MRRHHVRFAQAQQQYDQRSADREYGVADLALGLPVAQRLRACQRLHAGRGRLHGLRHTLLQHLYARRVLVHFGVSHQAQWGYLRHRGGSVGAGSSCNPRISQIPRVCFSSGHPKSGSGVSCTQTRT
jgi:hypothetical protein